jgi:hypothetical protein
MVKEASSVSNFKKLIIPIIALVILAAAYIIIDNLPEKEDETEATEERVEIFNFKKDDLAEIKIEGRDEILWFRYVTIQVEEEETTPDGTVEKKTVDRNVWQAVEPEGMKPNTSTIDNIAWNANTLKAQKVIEESPSDLSIYGLDNPVKLTFIMKDGTQNIIDVGNKIPTGGSYYVRKEGDPTVYTIGSYEAENLIRDKEKIAGVLMQAQEKAEAMMEEARGRAVEEKARLNQLLESEREKIVDIKRELKNLKNQITGILSRYQQEINETVMNIEQNELYYTTEETSGENENPDDTKNEIQAIPEYEDEEVINSETQTE